MVFSFLPVLTEGGKDPLHQADIALMTEPQYVHHLHLHVSAVGIAGFPGLEVGTKHVESLAALFVCLDFELCERNQL